MPPSSNPTTPATARKSPFRALLGWPLALLLFCDAALLVLWVLLALYSGHLDGGFAIAVAAGSAAMLRWGGMPRGTARAAVAVLATLGVAALAAWAIIALEVGFGLGLHPLAALSKLGDGLFWTLLQLAARPADFIGLLAGLLLAAWLAR